MRKNIHNFIAVAAVLGVVGFGVGRASAQDTTRTIYKLMPKEIAVFPGQSEVTISADVVFEGDAGLTGDISVNDLTVTGAQTVAETLEVTGVATFTATPVCSDGITVESNVTASSITAISTDNATTNTIVTTDAVIPASVLQAGTTAAAIDGQSITNLSGTAIASGTVADARVAATLARDTEVTAALAATTGSATIVTVGTVAIGTWSATEIADNKIASTIARDSEVTAALAATTGSATIVTLGTVAIGTIPASLLEAGSAATAINGAAITNITAANITNGNLGASVVAQAVTAVAEISVASGQDQLKDGSLVAAQNATNNYTATLSGVVVRLASIGGTNNATNNIMLDSLAYGEAGNMFYAINTGTTNNITITNGAVWLSPTIVIEENEVAWITSITSNTFYGGVLGQ